MKARPTDTSALDAPHADEPWTLRETTLFILVGSVAGWTTIALLLSWAL